MTRTKFLRNGLRNSWSIILFVKLGRRRRLFVFWRGLRKNKKSMMKLSQVETQKKWPQPKIQRTTRIWYKISSLNFRLILPKFKKNGNSSLNNVIMLSAILTNVLNNSEILAAKLKASDYQAKTLKQKIGFKFSHEG